MQDPTQYTYSGSQRESCIILPVTGGFRFKPRLSPLRSQKQSPKKSKEKKEKEKKTIGDEGRPTAAISEPNSENEATNCSPKASRSRLQVHRLRHRR